MLTTLAKLKTELSITDTASDAALTDLIEQKSAEIEGYCGRTFASATQTQVFRLKAPRIRLMLDRVPVSAVSSISVDGTALVAADFELEDAAAGFVILLDGNDNPICWQPGKVEVEYTAGFTTTPADVERCCIDLCVRVWHARNRDPNLRSESFEGVGSTSWTAVASQEMKGGLPVDVAERLDRYRIVRFA